MTKLTNYKCELVAESFVDDKESPRWVLHVVPDQMKTAIYGIFWQPESAIHINLQFTATAPLPSLS